MLVVTNARSPIRGILSAKEDFIVAEQEITKRQDGHQGLENWLQDWCIYRIVFAFLCCRQEINMKVYILTVQWPGMRVIQFCWSQYPNFQGKNLLTQLGWCVFLWVSSDHRCWRWVRAVLRKRILGQRTTAIQQELLWGSSVYNIPSVRFSSVAQLCPTLCNAMNPSTPGLPVHHQPLEFT